MAATSSRLLIGRSWMLFVDGENFTKRGQAVLSEGKIKPLAGPFWKKDVYLWLPGRSAHMPLLTLPTVTRPSPSPPAKRSYYYTSEPENEPARTETRLALRELGFDPRLYLRRQEKSKAVDIGLTTEVLMLAAQGRYEVAVIFAGDGDYVPVVEAVKTLGLYVVVGFFEKHGLSTELRIAADEFVDLTGYLASAWQAYAGRTDAAEVAVSPPAGESEAGQPSQEGVAPAQDHKPQRSRSRKGS